MAMTIEQALAALRSAESEYLSFIDTNGLIKCASLSEIADAIDAHLSAQAKVKVTNSGLPRELRLVCGHDSRSVVGCLHCEAADALESHSVNRALNETSVSDTELLEAAREVGLRAYLHGVGPTDAKNILRRFVDKIAARLSQGAQEVPEPIQELVRNQKTPSAEDRALITANLDFLVSQSSGNSGEVARGAQGEAVAWLDPDTQDAITDQRKRDWAANFGAGGIKKASSYTVPLYTHPPRAGADARDAESNDAD
jgi:hypothetical protein